ncbi:EAL domain-containing protein [Reinekea forsetii]|nr:EAL domain-containing protein [Reinekea forsetii]
MSSQTNMNIRLRLFLPFLLFSLLFIAIGSNAYFRSAENENRIRQSAKEQLKNIGNLISANIETAIRYNLSAIVASAIEQSQSTKSIRYSLLVNNNNKIYSSNIRDLQGKPLSEISQAEISRYLNKIDRRYILEFLDNQSPWLIYQIPLTRQSEDNVFGQKVDRLILISNISSDLSIATNLLIEELIIWGLLSSIITLIFWVILKYLVVDPISQLIDLSDSIAEGALPPIRDKNYMAEFISLDSSMRDTGTKIYNLERSYQELYDKTPATFITINDSLEIVNINEYGLKTLGYRKDEVIGKKAAELYSPNDKGLFEQYLVKILKGSQTLTHWELQRVTKSSRPFWTRDGARLIEQFGKKYILIVSQDISDLHKLSQKLSYQASHDDLTGLLNRVEFSRLMSMSLEKAQLQKIGHCVCFLDLDQFKVINDVCGHSAGDELLKQIANLFKKCLRKDDVLARIGGDEFGLLLESCSPEKAIDIIQNMRTTLEANRFNWGDKFFEIGISAGISVIDENSRSIQIVLSEADNACYVAKDLGRNRSIIFSPSTEGKSSLLGEMQWINKINQALESDDTFILYFQRIVPLDSVDKVSFKGEVLIRMIIDGKVIPPGSFLPAADRYNLAYKIDYWVVEKTLSTLIMFKSSLPQGWKVSINLSAQTCSSSKFNNKIFNLLKKYPDICKNICFELTETTAMANFTTAIEFMHRVHRIGIEFSIDDFGSGFSSFGYLKELPVQYVKIDGMFIRDLSDKKIDKTLVESMNNIAHALNKKTIAEFIENEKSVGILQSLNVDYGQGFYLHKPEPFTAYITNEIKRLEEMK